MENYQRIKDLREDADKTQEEIAKELNMHLTTYRRYESSEREPPFYFIIELSKLYNVSIDYIAGITNDKRGIGYKKEAAKYESDLDQIIKIAKKIKKEI